MAKQIYRQEALDRLSSPEQLDMLMPVTSARSWIALAGVGVLLAMGLIWGIFGRIASTVDGTGLLVRTNGADWVTTPFAGVVERLEVTEGDLVKKGDSLLSVGYLSDTGIPSVHVVKSPRAGRVLDIPVFVGDEVSNRTDLVYVETPSAPLHATIFVEAISGYKINKGMKVRLLPATEDEYSSNRLAGVITKAGKFPVSSSGMLRIVQNEDRVRALQMRGPNLQIDVEVTGDPNDPAFGKIFSGTPCSAVITTDEHAPIYFLFPY
ncbi:biotin/lipoyl-binding protein [Lignipirellula cremea]|uniref:Uncharacterized protein n=1 Tax=Lignipirellula cremea TaxID=2528010 RepID=A0A518DQP5_9BACT|nr:biotin/lipoyl-binding protein [Lignipirellula cremea]QDU94144.1 hypothetical protein Pla8534_19310 [Lignipirellula cremea]